MLVDEAENVTELVGKFQSACKISLSCNIESHLHDHIGQTLQLSWRKLTGTSNQ